MGYGAKSQMKTTQEQYETQKLREAYDLLGNARVKLTLAGYYGTKLDAALLDVLEVILREVKRKVE